MIEKRLDEPIERFGLEEPFPEDRLNGQSTPIIQRDFRRFIVWKGSGNSPMEDEEIGIKNIQSLFLERFPRFNARYPRMANGKIQEDQITEARNFILDQIGTWGKFISLMGGSPLNSETAPYFNGRRAVVLEKSFGVWGIGFPTKRGEQQKGIQLVNEAMDLIKEIIPETQEKGTKCLHEYLVHGNSFGLTCKPFLVRSFYGAEKEFVYIGTVVGKNVALILNDRIRKIAQAGGTVLVIPREDEYKLYQWIDFYEIDEKEQANIGNSLGSYRVSRNPVRFESKGWYGPARQAFLDYLAGKDTVDISMLRDFKVAMKNGGRLSFGEIDGEAVFTRIKDTQIPVGKEVVVSPQFDSGRNYLWVDINIPGEDEQKNTICSRRFQKGVIGLQFWEGPDRQAFVDWVCGRMAFDQVKPVRVRLDNKKPYFFFELTAENVIALRFQEHSSVRQFDELAVIPRRDNLYEWVEVYKSGDITEPDMKPLASYLIRREQRSKLDGNWPGPQRQRWIDFLDGKLDPSLLESLTVAKKLDSKGAYLFRYKGKTLDLQSNVRFLGQASVYIIPGTDRDGNLFVKVYGESGGSILATYTYNGKGFICVDSSRTFKRAGKQHSLDPEEAKDIEDLEEYEQRLLKGERLSYEECMKQKEVG